ncbi:MAG: NAD(P)-dependent glycerol-3-phosphate dehydrogenase [Acidobacteria bacterium]|nr:NAD(P)-dependent glycerol-3-phosphate dehydrogenase [Acidobacteriota bacterium]MCG3190888.1 Glycerol-3-phosphate dehydrogenase [NAD(P)+] [Thermoanaerobaculia bacterium]
MSKKIAVIGTGTWGTALAIHAARTGLSVSLLGRRPSMVEEIAASRRHPSLPADIVLPEAIVPTADPVGAFAGAEAILWAVSVQATRAEITRLDEFMPAEVPLVMTSKGVEIGSQMTPLEIIESVRKGRNGLAILSGPTFATEVARGLPTAAVIASRDEALSECLQNMLSSPTFRFYRSTDVRGVEIAGAVKNVVAIAAGIVDGLALGHNTRAALLTRALAEIRRLGTKLGGEAETFAGLAGTGDLFLTATGDLSRNRRVGLALAQGRSVEEAIASLGGEVAEGVASAPAIVALAKENGVVMPISEAVAGILRGEISARDAVYLLMTRRLKGERD